MPSKKTKALVSKLQKKAIATKKAKEKGWVTASTKIDNIDIWFDREEGTYTLRVCIGGTWIGVCPFFDLEEAEHLGKNLIKWKKEN